MHLVINGTLAIKLGECDTDAFIDKIGLNRYTLDQCFRVYDQYAAIDDDLAITFTARNGTIRIVKSLAAAHRVDVRYDISFYEMWK